MAMDESEPKRIKWSRQLMAIAQNGLTCAENHFDRERYEQVGFYPEDGLPGLSISRVTPGQIARLFEHHRDLSLPTDFD